MDGGNLLIDPRKASRQRTQSSKATSAITQPPLVRDDILSFLVQPHTTKEVADHIDRRTSTATGHLRAMRKKNLVVRLSWGTWIRRDKCLNPPDHASIRRGHPLQDAMLQHLTKPRTIAQLEAVTGQPVGSVKSSLAALTRRNLITRNGSTFVTKQTG